MVRTGSTVRMLPFRTCHSGGGDQHQAYTHNHFFEFHKFSLLIENPHTLRGLVMGFVIMRAIYR